MSENFAITKAPLDSSKIDARFLPYLTNWKVIETYKENTVEIPDYVPFNYYAVYDKPGETENELQVSIWCGWAGRSDGKNIDSLYDDEVIINLRIEGTDVLHPPGVIKAEILKSGGAPMQVLFKNKLVTDFTESQTVQVPEGLFSTIETIDVKVTNGYQTVSDMSTLV